MSLDAVEEDDAAAASTPAATAAVDTTVTSNGEDARSTNLELKPYSWEESGVSDVNNPAPPSEVLQLWTEVGNGIDKSQTGE
jgi:hypothetical protein